MPPPYKFVLEKLGIVEKLEHIEKLAENMQALMLDFMGKNREKKLSSKEAAKIMNLSLQSLQLYRKKKIGPPSYRNEGERDYYYLYGEVVDYLNNK
jgi:hypothetical protein